MFTSLDYLIDLIIKLYILSVCYVMLLSWYCQTPVLGLGVDFTFAWDNKNDNKTEVESVQLGKLYGQQQLRYCCLRVCVVVVGGVGGVERHLRVLHWAKVLV